MSTNYADFTNKSRNVDVNAPKSSNVQRKLPPMKSKIKLDGQFNILTLRALAAGRKATCLESQYEIKYETSESS